MLVACKSCKRQYDVADHEPGAQVRCFCGAVCLVPKEQARDLRMLHCSSCGGNLEKDATQCGYCGSEVTLGEKGLGDACPHCYCRMVAGSKFCSSCGASIEPEAVIKAMTSQDCPRCKQGLSLCEVGDASFVECTKCAGIWLDEKVFTRVAEKREESAVSSYIKANNRAVPTDGNAAATPGKVAYIPCPVCGQMMNRKNFANASGVIIDWCRGHGYWFDADELERIMAFIEGGGMERARDLDRERARLEAKRARQQGAAQLPPDMRAAMTGGWNRRSERSLLDTLADFVGAMLR